jgi:iron complex transport system substrate-binding protein
VKPATAINGAAFALAVASSMFAVWALRVRPAVAEAGHDAAAATQLAPLVDHAGKPLPRRDYRRIVSGSTLADAVLLEIAEPDRVVAFTGYSAHRGSQAYRYAGRPVIEHLDDLEEILALHPDLVLSSEIGDPRPVARLREAGVPVFDLGKRGGLATLIPNIHEMADILGHPERGDRFARALVEQMNAVAADVPPSRRPRAMYLSVYGSDMFGGGPGTSYHDVLQAAGLVDAATGYRDWPQYTIEQVLTLDPDVIVTNTGMRPRICEHAGLSMLRACQDASGVVEIDGALMGDAGPPMVEAAWAVRTAVHGPPRTTELTMKGRDP